MRKRVSADGWAAVLEMIKGAPRSQLRIARIAGTCSGTVSSRVSRDGSMRPDYRRAILRWDRGDAIGCLLEEVMASLAIMPEITVADFCRMLAERAADDGVVSGPVATDGLASGLAPGGEASVFTDMNPDERMVRLANLQSRQVAMILASAEAAGGVLNKGQWDALSANIRLAEKFEALASERAAEKQKRSDAEIAEVLAKVDDRIVELAEGYIQEKAPDLVIDAAANAGRDDTPASAAGGAGGLGVGQSDG